MEATDCSMEALRVNLWWSINVYENSNNYLFCSSDNVLYCYSYGLGCHKGAHSWIGVSMWYGKFESLSMGLGDNK